MNTSMQPLARHDVVIGQPLPFSIFDGNGKLLLAQGQIVRSPAQLDSLCANGYYPNPRWIRVKEPRRPLNDTDVDMAEPKRKTRSRIAEPGGDWAVRLKVDGFPETYPARLLGYMPGQTVLITAPRDEGKLLTLREGQLIGVKGFSGQTIYTFNGTVQKICFVPFPYIHVSWDDGRLEKTTVRNSRRVGAHIDASLVLLLPDGEQRRSVMVNDLSTGGAEITVSGAVTGKVRLEFSLEVAGANFPFHLTGSVRKRKDQGEQESVARFGVAFEDLLPEQKIALHAWIHEKLVERYECPLTTS